MLTSKDFVLAITVEDRKFYRSFDFKDYEICFEACLSGYCVAIYKKGPGGRFGDLVENKSAPISLLKVEKKNWRSEWTV